MSDSSEDEDYLDKLSSMKSSNKLKSKGSSLIITENDENDRNAKNRHRQTLSNSQSFSSTSEKSYVDNGEYTIESTETTIDTEHSINDSSERSTTSEHFASANITHEEEELIREVGSSSNKREKNLRESRSFSTSDLLDMSAQENNNNKNLHHSESFEDLVPDAEDQSNCSNFIVEDSDDENDETSKSLSSTTQWRSNSNQIIDDSDDGDYETTSDRSSANESISSVKFNKNLHPKQERRRSTLGSLGRTSTVETNDETLNDKSIEEVSFMPPPKKSPSAIIDLTINEANSSSRSYHSTHSNQSNTSQTDKDSLFKRKRELESYILKSKRLLKTANLPDNGQKLLKKMAEFEAHLANVEREIRFAGNCEVPTTAKNEPKPLSLDNIPNVPSANFDAGGFGKKAAARFEMEQMATFDGLKELHQALDELPPENETREDPEGLRVGLLLHQNRALAWLWNREKSKRVPGGILADDMGLGKTLTMIALVMACKLDGKEDSESEDEEYYSKNRRCRRKGGTLVVCPASLVAQWKLEVEKRVKKGNLSVWLHHGNKREERAKALAKYDMVITSYNILAREVERNGVCYDIKWKRVILDEAHVVRNHKSAMSKAVCDLVAEKRWALTGTPIHNKELDIYGIIKFLKITPFNDLPTFKRWISNGCEAGRQRLATIMKVVMLRRTKQELQINGILAALPEKTIERVETAMDKEERVAYEVILKYSAALLGQYLAQRAEKDQLHKMGVDYRYNNNSVYKKAANKLATYKFKAKQDGEPVTFHNLLMLLLRLRQMCCHPALIHAFLDRDDIEESKDVDGEEDPEGELLLEQMGKMNLDGSAEDLDLKFGPGSGVVLTKDNPLFEDDRQSSKMRHILDKVQELLPTGDKIVIVSQWASFLDVIGQNLRKLRIKFGKFTGKVAVKDRAEIVENFNNPNHSMRVLLLSLTAGGVGLNLCGGNRLMIVDNHWNPQLEFQAMDRVYRFGQTKNVHIYQFLCKDSIEERVKELQDKKILISNSVLTGSKLIAGAAKLSLQDLAQLLQV